MSRLKRERERDGRDECSHLVEDDDGRKTPAESKISPVNAKEGNKKTKKGTKIDDGRAYLSNETKKRNDWNENKRDTTGKK
jgi:hypothetical protein